MTHATPGRRHACVSKIGHYWFRWWRVTSTAPRKLIWINDSILLIGHLGINLSYSRFKIQQFAFKEIDLKHTSARWLPLPLTFDVIFLPKSTQSCHNFKLLMDRLMIQGIKIHPQEILEIIQFNPHSQSSIIYFKPLVDMNKYRIR